MATTTTNLGLTKQAPGEHASLVALNGNFDLIDAFAGSVGSMYGNVNASIPVGTTAGSYKIGTFASLDIPSGSTILSVQCNNVTQSVCVVTGFAVNGNDIYVYIAQDVAVAAGQVTVLYKAP